MGSSIILRDLQKCNWKFQNIPHNVMLHQLFHKDRLINFTNISIKK